MAEVKVKMEPIAIEFPPSIPSSADVKVKREENDRGVRRSTRLNPIPEPHPPVTKPEPTGEANDNLDQKLTMPPPKKPKLTPESTKNLAMNASLFVEKYLGQEIPSGFGGPKTSVMHLGAAGGAIPKFNKYSGIQEWLDGVFLFVNIGGECYNNVFRDEGKQIEWFAQPTQTLDSPVLAKICGGLVPVLLFCRIGASPYHCLGRLGFAGCEPGKVPIKFILELLDFNYLMEQPDIRGNFEEMVRWKRE